MPTIKIIYDNCKTNESFQVGWGFSCLIESSSKKILFDTGADPAAFFFNLSKLNINCSDITDVVISHKHFDHTGSLAEIIEQLKPTATMYFPTKFPLKKIPPKIRFEVVEDEKQIDSGVYSLVLKGGFFLYEQILILENPSGLSVITGCAHPGIVNILEVVKDRFHKPLHFVLGGFHLFRSRHKKIREIVKKFKELQVQSVAPCHCSGNYTMQEFQNEFGPNFCKVGAGSILSLL